MAKDEPPLRFDLNMPLKEDYDFSCQHISTFGSVVRCNRLHVVAKHYQAGGCTDARATGNKGKVAKQYLHTKWPGMFMDNKSKKLPDEIILRWKDEPQDRLVLRKPASRQQKTWKAVLKGKLPKTGGNLKSSAVIRNKRGHVVSKKLSDAGKRNANCASWSTAVSLARQELGITQLGACQ